MRGPGLWILACAAGAGLVLLGAGREWAALTAGGRTAAVLTGGEVSAAPVPLALAAAAAAVAVLAVRGVWRMVVAAVLALCGAGVAVAVWTGTAGLAPDAFPAVATDGATVAVQWAWPALTCAGGLLLAVCGVVAIVRGRHWRGMSARYDRAVPAASGERAMWDALDRGLDPTEDRPGTDTDHHS